MPATPQPVAGGSVRSSPVVAEAVRSGFVESRHHGRVVGLASDGSLVLAAGDVAAAVYGRSTNKPMQAVAMVELGLTLPAAELAVATASHSGESMHLAAVRSILAAAGLDESALENTPDLPLGAVAARDWLAGGGTPCSLTQNCSGKHAAMLLTCVINGWPTVGCLASDHPLQLAIATTIARLTGEPVAHVGVDGCGAPAHAVSLVGLARAFRSIATADRASASGRVADAMRRFPEMVGGSDRDVTGLMRAVPGMIAKEGAEGVYAAALDDGRAVALKIDDGASRARAPVMVDALARLGIDVGDAGRAAAASPILGHGLAVGSVRPHPY